MQDTNIEVKAGGASFNAAAAMSLTRDQFVERYMRLNFANWIESESERRKYLSGMWDECKRRTEKVKHKQPEEPKQEEATETEQESKPAPVVKEVRSRKHTEKKE